MTTRQQKTPRQRAEEALAVAERALARLNTKREKHLADAKAVEPEIHAAQGRVDYLSQSPDLPRTEPTAVPDTSQEAQQ